MLRIFVFGKYFSGKRGKKSDLNGNVSLRKYNVKTIW